ncbi:MAG: transglutaminase domain-containing protein [Chitinispirillaceae bacterium]|nr:transglutaminase domain-containing protein [Chitinispirillaceae bacterium]
MFRYRPPCIIVVFILILSFVIHSAEPPGNSLSILRNHSPISDTLSVFLQERPAGTLIATLSASSAGIVNSIVLSVEMNVPGGKQRIGMEELRTYSPAGDLLSAILRMESPAGNNIWKLDKHRSGRWEMTVITAGVVNRRTLPPVRESVRSLEALYGGVFSGTLQKGSSWKDSSFELTSGELVVTVTICSGTPRDTKDSCWEFICTDNLLDRKEIWKINRRGETTYREMYPYTAKKTTAGDTAAPTEATDTDAMFEMMKIPVPTRLVDGKQRVKVTFANGQMVDTSVARFYERNGDGFLLRPFLKKCLAGKTVPLSTEERTTFLSATSTLQVTNPKIRRLADSLGNGIKDPCKKVAVFNHAVYNRLAKRNVATFSSALETLEAGYGDCGEHAVLLAALLRAAGIPARVVLGVLYVAPKRGYYYHAWVMAYTGSWVFADPSHDSFPANSDRVPLVIDDDGTRMISVAKVIGRISIAHVPSGIK